MLAIEALKKDMKLLESSAQEGAKGKTLVPKAIDADDEDDRGGSDDDSDDDDDEVGPARHQPIGENAPLLLTPNASTPTAAHESGCVLW